MVVCPRAKKETRRVAEDAVVNICVFHDRMRVVPFAVEDEANANSYGEHQNIAE